MGLLTTMSDIESYIVLFVICYTAICFHDWMSNLKDGDDDND